MYPFPFRFLPRGHPNHPNRPNLPTGNLLWPQVMSDPDAPSAANPYYGEYVHWLAVNAEGGDVAAATQAVPYTGGWVRGGREEGQGGATAKG